MIPSTLRAGSAYEWSISASLLSGETSFVYTFFNASGVFSVSSATADFAVASSASAGWPHGVYDYTLRAVDGSGNKREIETGTVRVQANVDISLPVDGRSHARRVLDAIEATLEGRASDDAQEISIRGRTIKSTPLADLMRMRSVYKAEVRAEEDARRASQGLPSRRLLRTRFVNG
jgi:hypothetical protein